MIRKYSNKGVFTVYNIFLCVLLLLVGAVFVYTPGDIAATQVFGFSGKATDPNHLDHLRCHLRLLPDRHRVPHRRHHRPDLSRLRRHPAVLRRGRVHRHLPQGLSPAERVGRVGRSLGFNGADPFNYQDYFDANHFLPVFFVTVACGILSGFHSTQTAIITRTMKSERQGRTTFYWMMILEGFIAMVWAAGAMGVYNLGLQEANASLATATIGVVCKDILGPVGGIIALLGVIILPVTSGDTALRALRLTVSESFHMDQSNNGKRLTLAVPIFVLVAAIIVWAKFNTDGFNTLWRYFAWSNQTLSLFAFLAISVWMFENKKSKFVWIPLIPGAWYTFICVTYIANAQIGFRIPWTPAYVIGVCAAIAYVVVIVCYGKKRAARLAKA